MWEPEDKGQKAMEDGCRGRKPKWWALLLLDGRPRSGTAAGNDGERRCNQGLGDLLPDIVALFWAV